MSCELCGRNSCTKSFHSSDEQDMYDSYIEYKRISNSDMEFHQYIDQLEKENE